MVVLRVVGMTGCGCLGGGGVAVGDVPKVFAESVNAR